MGRVRALEVPDMLLPGTVDWGAVILTFLVFSKMAYMTWVIMTWTTSVASYVLEMLTWSDTTGRCVKMSGTVPAVGRVITQGRVALGIRIARDTPGFSLTRI